MSDAIQPALTPDEWAANGIPLVGADGARLYVDRDVYEGHLRHALAALALHQQPFGFTHADVALLCNAADMVVSYYIEGGAGAAAGPERDAFYNLAVRIAALLPPDAPSR